MTQSDYKYHDQKTLSKYVGQAVWFLSLNGPKLGTLVSERGKLWLPESGGVNATTVKIKLQGSQLSRLEHLTHNQAVAGSNPAEPTN